MPSRVTLLLVKVALTAFWATVIGIVVLGSVPESPIPFTPEERLSVLAVAPEGWAFFTRSPREHIKHLYRPTDEGWTQVDRSNFTVRNWMGVKRTSTIENVELHHLLRLAKGEDGWTACRKPAPACLASGKGPTVSVRNETASQMLCGSIAVQRREPVPWAWSGAEEPVVMPSEVLRLDVTCPEEGT